MTAGSHTFHDDFRLSITKALGDQLAQALSQLGRAPLNYVSLAQIDERPGVYQLYLDDKFVYVGKAERSLRQRLGNHLRKLSGRRNMDVSSITFACLYVAEDFSALAPEQLLISHHKEIGEIPWNNNGFGNKDPGRQRDNTILKDRHFDVCYPINLNLRVDGLIDGNHRLDRLLKIVKEGLPFNFRYKEPPEAKKINVQITTEDMTADRALQRISDAAPENWQITALMGYVIMYDDAPRSYDSAWRYYRGGALVNTEPAIVTGEVSVIDEIDLWGSEK